jgi:alpha-tubulin suppressor-like RCC1 family protein
MKNILLILFLFGIQNSIEAQCYKSLSFGGTHTVGIKNNGSLWGWGRADYGQLGNNNLSSYPIAIQIGTINNVKKIYPGVLNTFIIKNDGTLWGIGSNVSGSLGVNSTSDYFTTFQQITTATNWQKISPSLYFTLALKEDGTIWAWGEDNDGQTGNPPATATQNIPIQIGIGTDWIDVASGTSSTAFALKADGTLWGWGANVGDVLVPASNVYSLPVPTQINTVNTWVKMSVGSSSILAQKADGTLWAWGTGIGRGVGTTLPPGIIPYQISTATWKNFSAGDIGKSFGVMTDGTLWAWGDNMNGQLGIGSTVNQSVPVQIGTDTNWDSVQAGSDWTSMAIKTDGSIWYWGQNYFGEFGNGSDYGLAYFNTPQLTPNICVTTLSTASFERESAVLMYPNPATDKVNIRFETPQGESQVEIYDLTGRLISSFTNTDNQGVYELDLAPMATGVYVVVLRQGGVVLMQRKLQVY